MPDTIPPLVIEAIDEALELHAPPVVALVSVVVEPIQTEAVPPIAAGSAFTVTVRTTKQPVPSV